MSMRFPGTERIEKRFAQLAAEDRAGLVTYVMSGDPDIDTASEILKGLPGAGADLIELGMAFTDPMADGPAIQVAGLRALKAGITVRKTLDMVRRFREGDQDTPIILMGYYNPIYSFGVEAFLQAAGEAGVDGLIIVDVPAEEDDELCKPALDAGLSFIRLIAPTTDDERLPTVLANTAGFVYYVSYTGITGAQAAPTDAAKAAVTRVQKFTDLPVAVGFGIRTPEQAAEIARGANAVVVGTALIERVRDSLDPDGKAGEQTVSAVLDAVTALAQGIRSARP